MVDNQESYSFVQKAAVLLMSLETKSPGITSRVFTHMGEDRSKVMLKAISSIGKVDAPVVNKVIEEFYALAIEHKIVFGGKNVSAKILKDTFGIEEQSEYFSDKKGLFSFLNQVSDKDLELYFENETMQTSALILSSLSEDRMARIMAQLDVDKATTLSQKILSLDIPDTKLVWKYQIQLESLLLGDTKQTDTSTDQLFKLSRVLEMMAPGIRETVMTKIGESDEAALDRLQKLIFSFEDLEWVPDKDLQSIFYEVDPLKKIAISIRNSDESLIVKVRDNLSERVNMMLDEEIENLSDTISEEDVIKCQNTIVQIARKLERSGRIEKLHSKETQESTTHPIKKDENLLLDIESGLGNELSDDDEIV